MATLSKSSSNAAKKGHTAVATLSISLSAATPMLAASVDGMAARRHEPCDKDKDRPDDPIGKEAAKKAPETPRPQHEATTSRAFYKLTDICDKL